MDKSAKQRIKKRYDYWKKVGYDITYKELPDRLKVTFINHDEKLPCYIEYLDNRIICYGDYSSYIFENYYSIDKNPSKVNYTSVRYILGKIDKNIKIKDFDYHKAIEDIEKIVKYYKLRVSRIGRYSREDIKEMIDDLKNDINEQNYYVLLENFSNKLQLDDLWENLDDFGMVYTPHVLAQLVMMQLIDEDYRSKKSNEN